MLAHDDIITRANADLQRARASAARAKEALARAEKEVADLQAFIRTFERYTGASVSQAFGEHSVNMGISQRTSGRAKEMVDVAIAAIEERGSPMLIGELLDAVLAAGHVIGGRDQKSNLAGYLSRDPRVRSVGRNIGWDVVSFEQEDEACPENYQINHRSGEDKRETIDDFNDLI